MSNNTTDKTETISELNDRFRKGDEAIQGQIMITSGVQDLIAETGEATPYSLSGAVRSFDNFDADNDPYREHDFGAFDFHGEKVFWKIDYYAPDLVHGADDPADPQNTMRVLTIMRAFEY